MISKFMPSRSSIHPLLPSWYKSLNISLHNYSKVQVWSRNAGKQSASSDRTVILIKFEANTHIATGQTDSYKGLQQRQKIITTELPLHRWPGRHFEI